MKIFIISDPGATWRIPGEPMERSWERMCSLVRATRDAGANAFKPQFYRARLVYPDNSLEYELLRRYEMPEQWLPRLRSMCERLGLEFMCTIYHPDHVDLLYEYVKRWKVSSFEAGHTKLIEAMVATNKPLIVSLGLGQETSPAFQVATERTTALHCVSAYPATARQMRLGRIRRLPGIAKGLSDHSIDDAAAIMSVALGARVIEHHIRADETPVDNPDYGHSFPPSEFKAYVYAIRQAELMMQEDKIEGPSEGERIEWKWNRRTGLRGVAK